MNNTEKAMIKQNRNKEVALFVIVLPRARRRDVFRPRPANCKLTNVSKVTTPDDTLSKPKITLGEVKTNRKLANQVELIKSDKTSACLNNIYNK